MIHSVFQNNIWLCIWQNIQAIVPIIYFDVIIVISIIIVFMIGIISAISIKFMNKYLSSVCDDSKTVLQFRFSSIQVHYKDKYIKTIFGNSSPYSAPWAHPWSIPILVNSYSSYFWSVYVVGMQYTYYTVDTRPSAAAVAVLSNYKYKKFESRGKTVHFRDTTKILQNCFGHIRRKNLIKILLLCIRYRYIYSNKLFKRYSNTTQQV